ncbi:hypothetical protein ACIPWI_25090 [Streptomyces sp. NPDC090046]|uniref:hypothetical protein n=1 Tax=Streptomyces sp. NPDC090046 TaxID=3365928 RepID=UPI0037FCA70F
MVRDGRRNFATGQLLRVSLDGSSARLVNAGHPWPLRRLILKTATEHPCEVVRTLVAAVADAYDGRPPRDEATVLCLDWYGPSSGIRRPKT